MIPQLSIPTRPLRIVLSGLIVVFATVAYQPVHAACPELQQHILPSCQRNPLYAELAQRSGQLPAWNSDQHRINQTAARVQSFESAVAPDDTQLLAALHKLLNVRKSLIRKT